VGGIWCSPFEIEAKLIEHARVLEAAVVGRPDQDNLIKPEAWIVLKHAKDAGSGLARDLLRLCQTTLAPYKYPRWFNFVEELPKTATGKIQRVKLRDVSSPHRYASVTWIVDGSGGIRPQGNPSALKGDTS
jgi:acyl-coenzyme A synthetase/AMP-(fatty) acid ligase